MPPPRLLVLLLPLLLLACSPIRANLEEAPNPSVAEADGRVGCGNEVVDAVVALTNREREARGLVPLECDDQLVEVARKHAADMCRRDYFAHVGPDGSTPADRAREGGIDFRAVGENVALGARTAVRVHREWMKSRGHRKNIVREPFRRIGVAYHPCNGQPSWVQLFAD